MGRPHVKHNTVQTSRIVIASEAKQSRWTSGLGGAFFATASQALHGLSDAPVNSGVRMHMKIIANLP
jgi:hypothetical protein